MEENWTRPRLKKTQNRYQINYTAHSALKRHKGKIMSTLTTTVPAAAGDEKRPTYNLYIVCTAKKVPIRGFGSNLDPRSGVHRG